MIVYWVRAMKNKSQFALRFQNVIFTTLFLVVIGLLAYVGKTYNKRFDVTQSQSNSLSETMQSLLKKLDKPLDITAYVPDDAVVKTNLKQLIEKYRVHHKEINLEFVNPDLNPSRAQKDGIAYSGQLLLKYGSKSEAINSVDEQNVLNVLQRLSRGKAQIVIVLEGHGEASPFEDKSNGISKLAEVLEKKGFSLQPHNILRTQSIPDNASFVVIAAPKKDYLEAEVDLISEYIEQGGNVLWLHEPGELFGLDDIEQRLGLALQIGTLVDANQDLQRMLGIQHPAAIAIIDYGASELTKDLAAHTLFPFATTIEKDIDSSIDPGPNANSSISDDSDTEDDNTVNSNVPWKYQSLLNTLNTSWLESGDIQGNVRFDDEADKQGPLAIGMSLTRDNLNAINRDTKVIPEQRIVVLGDSDFMRNNYIGQGSNLELSTNLFNWLSADDELLSIKNNIATGTTLNLTKSGRISLALLWIGLPITLFGFGMWRWVRRRKR